MCCKRYPQEESDMEIKQTNFAIIGLGGRGQGNLGELISIDGVKVVAVCDKYEDRARVELR